MTRAWIDLHQAWRKIITLQGVYAVVGNLFNRGRHLVAVNYYHDLRVSTFTERRRVVV